MKIRLTDILQDGCHVEFDLNHEAVTRRAAPDRARAPKDRHQTVEVLECRFESDPHCVFDLTLDGRTVQLEGRVTGEFIAACARCAEDCKTQVDVPVEMVLKPESERQPGEPEDVDFGYYSGEEIDSAAIAEEALMLAIPYVVLCSESCRGLCPHCGMNLNQKQCGCRVTNEPESPFRILKDIKIV